MLVGGSMLVVGLVFSWGWRGLGGGCWWSWGGGRLVGYGLARKVVGHVEIRFWAGEMGKKGLGGG